jgi:hypothetical protein
LGNLYAFDLDVFTDDGAVQKWLRSWRALPTGQNDLKRTAHHSLQLDAETGAIDASVTTPIIEIDVSNPNDDLLTESGDYLVWEAPASAGGRLLIEESSFTATAIDPQVMLRWSDDGGHTWSNSHWRSMGKTGAYGTRVLWRRLGMTLKLRDRVYEVSGTDQTKIAIVGAELIMSPTNV